MLLQAQGLLPHLIELRRRLIQVLLVILSVTLVALPWSNDFYALLAQPMLNALPPHAKLIATSVTAPFFIPFKITLAAAFVATLPHTLYQLWRFVAPGLYVREKKLILPLVLSSTALFFVGIGFAYGVALPIIFQFLAASTPYRVEWMTDIGNYLNFIIRMFIAFGLSFETPIVVVLLVKMDIVTVHTLRASRAYVVVAAFILAALVAPPDILSQFLLALPLCGLYEVGLLVGVYVERRKN